MNESGEGRVPTTRTPRRDSPKNELISAPKRLVILVLKLVISLGSLVVFIAERASCTRVERGHHIIAYCIYNDYYNVPRQKTRHEQTCAYDRGRGQGAGRERAVIELIVALGRGRPVGGERA